MYIFELGILLSVVAVVSAEEQQCGLYLASSQTSTDSLHVWGTYVGHDVKPGERIGFPNLAVNVHDIRAQNLDEYGEDEDEYEFLNAQATYLLNSAWPMEAAGAVNEFAEATFNGEAHSSMLINGPGMLAIFAGKGSNADFDASSNFKEPSLGEERGVSHPNRGAVSPFYNVVLKAKDRITAGSEVVVEFLLPGETESTEEEEDKIFADDYVKIDETVDQMLKFFEKHESALDTDSKQQIYRFLTEDFMNAAVGEAKARRISELLPASPDELPQVKAAGGIQFYNASGEARQQKLDWLKKHGMCMDNIRPGASTIKHAGRGAFANRKIPQGGLVVPVPLLQIPDKVSLDMYTLAITPENRLAREEDLARGRQLLYNYVYGHRESSMVFFPAGATAALINHADTPNAKMQWSTHPGHHSDWFNLAPFQFLEYEAYYKLGLVMEIVALRDIEEGEEIVIDYGENWKAAWAQWEIDWLQMVQDEVIDQEWPTRAADLNEQYRTTYFRTVSELEDDEPYPENVALKAFLVFYTDSGETGGKDDPFVWTLGETEGFFGAEHVYDIEIVERHADEQNGSYYVYTVLTVDEANSIIRVSNVPHSAIFFADQPETGDQFHQPAFRHYIEIPDDIFPQGPWRNLVPAVVT